ncbi:hypothetical protein GCM10027562_19520 [Arthrobacter pigmenti]
MNKLPQTLVSRHVGLKRGALTGMVFAISLFGAACSSGVTSSGGSCAAGLTLDGNLYYQRAAHTQVSGEPLDKTARTRPCLREGEEPLTTPSQIEIAAIPGVDIDTAFIAPQYESTYVYIKQSVNEALYDDIIDKATE